MQNDRLRLIQHLFDASAGRYERDITPVLAPLTADLIAYAAPRRADRVLDVGTGTGLAMRLIAPWVRHVIGIDISRESLRVARQTPTTTKAQIVRADLHRMPFATDAFSLVIASFGLNATDPADSLRAIRRVIEPGGRLVIQEWGPHLPVDLVFRDVLNEYSLDDPGEELAALRDWIDENPARWTEQLQDVEDYTERLTDLGFEVEDARETAPVAIRLASAETYIIYKLAWTFRFEEVRAMDESTRAAFFAAIRARLAEFAAPDGSFLWEPIVFRVTARLV
jgi:ubiquinone/menaquinone biosynthesis C-methylase UbiE